mmetsp:Transcript_14661/g.30106  ORF Transcript_14661/g.30106 Transcript_14661/m.30106 type:complete len:217 (-) Transcript_14661:559-1209(-)
MFFSLSGQAMSLSLSRTTLGSIFMHLALLAYLRVLWESSNMSSEGLMLAMMMSLHCPSRLDLSKWVSLESRYLAFFRVFPWASAFIQFARAKRERLMFAPSWSLLPLLLVFPARSDPARSIRLTRDSRVTSLPLELFHLCFMMICRTACEREEVAFASVAWVRLLVFPNLNKLMTSSQVVAPFRARPPTPTMPALGSSCTGRFIPLGSSKSLIFSL